MSESIVVRTNAMPDDLTAGELYQLMLSVLVDLAALRTALKQPQ